MSFDNNKVSVLSLLKDQRDKTLIGQRGAIDHLFRSLSPREIEVLLLFLDGRSDVQIAKTLISRPQTVRNQLSNIRRKLGAANRTELVLRVVQCLLQDVLRD